MRTDDEILIKALEILSNDIQTDDGVANACIAEAAQRLRELIAPANVNMFKRGQVWEDERGELVMIAATSKRENDYEVEYVHEDGYIGSAYASKAQGWKLYSDLVQRLDIDLTKCRACGGEADNGIDRGDPPQPYNCKKCHGEGDKAVPEGVAADALSDAIKAIETLPDDCFGYAENNDNETPSVWPIKLELLEKMKKAMLSAAPQSTTEGD